LKLSIDNFNVVEAVVGDAMFTLRPKGNRNIHKGQIIMEFIFSMMVLLLMIYGTMMVFRWTGVDLGNRRVAHDTILLRNINEDYSVTCDPNGLVFGICTTFWEQATEGPIEQIDPYFHRVSRMNAIWDGS